MDPIQQADRQWLDYLYSKSPSTALEYGLFRIYYRCKREWNALRASCLNQRHRNRIKVTCQWDRHHNAVWHAYNPALNLSFSTYSHQELQCWLAIHDTLNDVISAPEPQQSTDPQF